MNIIIKLNALYKLKENLDTEGGGSSGCDDRDRMTEIRELLMKAWEEFDQTYNVRRHDTEM